MGRLRWLTEVVLTNKPRFLFLNVFLVLYFLIGIATAFTSEIYFIHALDVSPIVCPLRKFTGFLCSFCGMTHAWIYFWHGDFAKAQAENLLAVPLFLGTPIFVLSKIFSDFWSERRIRYGIVVGVLILMVYAIARNIS